MKIKTDNLAEIGSIVEVENTDDEPCLYLVIGHRVINPFTMRAWDYISVPYPRGFKRIFNSEKKFDYDDFFYFNQYEVEKLIIAPDINLEKKKE